jgi:hypothetical protein
MPRGKAPEILRNEAYLDVRCNDEDKGNDADGRFSTACYFFLPVLAIASSQQ